MKKASILALAAALAVAGAGHAGTNTFQPIDTSHGTVLAASNGMTLYTYEKDNPNTSNCYGKCAANWPPYTANSAAQPYGKYTLVERQDGQRQWALNGEPLYFRIMDKKLGDVSGDGVKEEWQVAHPA